MKKIKLLLCISTCSLVICACGSQSSAYESKEAEISSTQSISGTAPKSEPISINVSQGRSVAPVSTHTHEWGTPSYTWKEDYSSCTAKRVCTLDRSHEQTETAAASYQVVTEPTYEETGLGRYTATFNNPGFTTQTYEVTLDKLEREEELPIFSEDNKTVTYGRYPQSRITDTDLLEKLEEEADWQDSGYYLYEGEYYAKVYSQPYKDDYKFDDGTIIKTYVNYWFKYEPITWRVLNAFNNEYLLLSDVLLDATKYDSTNNNNYKDSSIRDYINSTFFNRAFAFGSSNVLTTTVDNSAPTTGTDPNQFECDDTEDKVFLLSYKDYINTDYGFDGSPTSYSSTRYCKTTEFARAKGALTNTSEDKLNNGLYWTRSPNAGNKRYASHVRDDGYIGYDNNCSYAYLCVRPAIRIKRNIEQ